jgi:hypothetical protein
VFYIDPFAPAFPSRTPDAQHRGLSVRTWLFGQIIAGAAAGLVQHRGPVDRTTRQAIVELALDLTDLSLDALGDAPTAREGGSPWHDC